MNASTQTLPYGTWPSPLSADDLVTAAAAPHGPLADGDALYWLTTRPESGSRVILVRRETDGATTDLTPQWLSVRSRVHEYGGGEFAARDGIVLAVDDETQRVWVREEAARGGSGADRPEANAGPRAGSAAKDGWRPLTPEVPGRALRYAAMEIDPARRVAWAIREDHRDAAIEPVNELVRLDLDAAEPHEGVVVRAGRRRALPRPDADDAGDPAAPDFVLDPALSPGGDHLAWIEWSHPKMPWEATRLLVGDLDGDGDLVGVRVVAGAEPGSCAGVESDPIAATGAESGPSAGADGVTSGTAPATAPAFDGEAVTEPVWAGPHALAFLSDRTGFALPYAIDVRDASPEHRPLVAPDDPAATSEFGMPAWAPRERGLVALGDGRLAAVRWVDGFARLTLVEAAPATGDRTGETAGAEHGGGTADLAGDALGATPTAPAPTRDVDTDVTVLSELAPWRGGIVAAGAFADRAPGVVRVPLDGGPAELLAGPDAAPPAGLAPTPEPITWPGANGLPTHGFLYRPTNPQVGGPDGERPPLVVVSHGGPTAAALPRYSASVAYFTSRGFAVLDVAYGGSTGFGRDYRRRLEGQWGVVDVADCTSGARHLAEAGVVDPARLAIRGGSAGGFTTLAALTFGDVFTAGISRYGISDLAVLAADTHKFESRYPDGLVGPWPAARTTYEERSPLHHLDGLSCPMLLLQGDEDRVVPPNQAHLMADAVRAKGLPVALVVYPGEGHGFREPANVRAAWQAELAFLARVWGFTPADDLPALDIENLPA